MPTPPPALPPPPLLLQPLPKWQLDNRFELSRCITYVIGRLKRHFPLAAAYMPTVKEFTVAAALHAAEVLRLLYIPYIVVTSLPVLLLFIVSSTVDDFSEFREPRSQTRAGALEKIGNAPKLSQNPRMRKLRYFHYYAPAQGGIKR